MASLTAADLVRAARSASGWSQRTLARRARTAQSVIARIEGGQTSPSWDTLVRILAAAGVEPHVDLRARPVRTHMLRDVARILRLTPEQRLIELRNADRFFVSAERL